MTHERKGDPMTYLDDLTLDAALDNAATAANASAEAVAAIWREMTEAQRAVWVSTRPERLPEYVRAALATVAHDVDGADLGDADPGDLMTDAEF